MKAAAVVCVVFGAILPIFLPQTVADCCLGWPWKCHGARVGIELPAGAVGGCNIFCCNCNGGCSSWYPDCLHWYYPCALRRLQHLHDHDTPEMLDQMTMIQLSKDQMIKRSARFGMSVNYNNEAERAFSKVDINGDKFISIEEAEIFFEKQDHNSTTIKRSANNFFVWKEIGKLDENRDGLISPQEFDESLRN